MELNKKNLEALAAVIKKPVEDLTKALTEDGELNLNDRVVYTKEEDELKYKNARDEGYKQGNKSAIEKPLRNLKQQAKEKYKVETDGINDYSEFLDFTITSISDELKESLSGNAGEKEKKFIDQIEEAKKNEEQLRNKLKETESTWEQKLAEMKQLNDQSIVNNQLLKIADSIPFAIPKEVENEGKEKVMDYVNKQKELFLTVYKAKHGFSFNDNKFIIREGEEIIKNNLLEPVDPNEHALNFAKSNYFKLTENQVINRDGSQKYGSTFPGMSLEDFQSLMKEKNIHPGSNEYLIYFKEFQDKNK